jgi:hypothetical protein
MGRLEDQLGAYRSLLLRRVLGEKLELDAVASVMLGIAVPVDRRAQSVFANVLLAHFLNSLDASSAILGLNPFVRSVTAIASVRLMTDAQNIGHLAEVSHQPR